MQQRTILHCDMNNCFASIEAAINPKLKGKAIAVCGSQEERHGIVLAKSEKAKKAGVKTGEAIWQAQQKCRDLIIVEPHYDIYSVYSRKARSIYYQYTDRVEPFGLDECWLDVTESLPVFGSGEDIANILRMRMKQELGITISVGVSFNKIFAKLGSDMKKPDAVTTITYDGYKSHIWGMPADTLLFVGRATYSKLKKYGIITIGDLANAPINFIQRLLGKNGYKLWLYANGLDMSEVAVHNTCVPIKSIGHGNTCVEDLENEHEVYVVLMILAREVAERLRDNQVMASGIRVGVRDNTLAFRQFQEKLRRPTQAISVIAKAAKELFAQRYDWENNVRALTISAFDLIHDDIPVQGDMFRFDLYLKEENVDKAIYGLRKRFGDGAVVPAALLGKTKMSGKPFGSSFGSEYFQHR